MEKEQFKGRRYFFSLVRQMQDAQKHYFRTHDENVKETAKAFEAIVDREIEKGDASIGERTEYTGRLYFFGIVKRARIYQKRYFATRDEEAKRIAIEFEKLIDKEIKNGDRWMQEQLQPQLFN